MIGLLMENVIQFPRVINGLSSPLSQEERSEIISNLRKEVSDEICDDIMQNVINFIVNCGLISSELIVRDAIFLEETIKAVVYRYKNIPHQFHSLIDDVIVMPEDMENEDDEDDESDEESEKELEVLLTLEEHCDIIKK
jgi:hypothetical protein